MQEKLLEIYAQSFKDNWELPALSNYISKKTITYGEFAKSIARYHLLFKECGIKKGDKIALLGKNTPEWIQIFFATITYGAVIVPVLNDFNPQDAQHIVNHSDSVLLFVSQYIWESIEYDRLPKVKAVFSLDNNELLAESEESEGNVINAMRNLSSIFNAKYPNGFRREDISYPDVDPNALAVINYTSGTTGFSKGVMLSYNNLCGNVIYGLNANLHFRGSRCVSFLPLAHAYGCAFDMLVPLAIGTHITLLGKLPSPKILIKAMSEIRPNLVICVPLILEKIYRKQIVPMITKQTIRWALAIPFIDTAIYSQIRKKLIEAFERLPSIGNKTAADIEPNETQKTAINNGLTTKVNISFDGIDNNEKYLVIHESEKRIGFYDVALVKPQNKIIQFSVPDMSPITIAKVTVDEISNVSISDMQDVETMQEAEKDDSSTTYF